jgi:hypothetical protein
MNKKEFLVPFVGIEVEEEESGITCWNVCVCHVAQNLGKQQRKQEE